MSKHARRRPLHEAVPTSTDLLAKVEQELAQGYFEVEITGLTLRRLVCVYTVMMRGAWAHTLDNVRSRWRPTPAL